MGRVTCLWILLAAGSSAIALADEPSSRPSKLSSSQPAPRPVRQSGVKPSQGEAKPPSTPTAAKSPTTAMLLSLLSTTIPISIGMIITNGCAVDFGDLDSPNNACFSIGIALIGSGAIFGPSAGHYYAGELGRGLAWTMLRLVSIGGGGALGVIGGFMAAEETLDRLWGGEDTTPTGTALLVSGILITIPGIVLMVWDLVDAPLSARRANDSLVHSLSLAPLVADMGDTGHAHYGVALVGRF